MRTSLYVCSVCTFVAVMVAVASSAAAFERQSFRLRGMGGGLSWLVQDRFTDVFNNPATLINHAGMSVFTNLSNIDDQGNTSFLSSSSDQRIDLTGTLLLGGTYTDEAQKFGVGLFVEYGDIAVKGELSGLGAEASSEATSSQPGVSELLLHKESLSYTTLDMEFRDSAVLLPFSFALSDKLSLGGMFVYEDFSGELLLGDRDEDFQLSEVSAFSIEREQAVSSAQKLSFNDNRAIGGTLGMQYLSDDYSLDVVLGYAPRRFALGLEEIDAMIGGTLFGISVSNAVQFVDPGGFDLYAPAVSGFVKTRFRLAETFSLTAVVGFEQMEIHSDLAVSESKRLLRTHDPEDYEYSSQEVDSSRYELSAAVIDIPIRLGLNWTFSEWGIFALGFNTHIYRMDIDYVAHPEVNTRTYNFKNPPFSHEYVSEVMSTNNDYTTLTGEAWTGILSVPVGVEVLPTEWFALRLGAETFLPLFSSGKFEVHSVDEPDYEQVISTNPVDGSRTFVERDEDAQVVRAEGFSEAEELNYKITLYSAGLGFRLNDNIRIDALSFANLTNLAYWKLSLGFNYQF